MLEAGIHDIPAGHVAAVLTHLEMRAPAPLRPETDHPYRLRRETDTDPEAYRALYRSIGAPWLWFGHLVIDDGALAALLADPAVHRYTLRDGASPVGLLVLDFRIAGECELLYFGVVEAEAGGGAGRWLMNRAIGLAWQEGIERFHVHTCTNDHPNALAFYVRSGFVPIRRQIEIAPDPRLQGHYPPDAAPRIPLLGEDGGA